MRLIERTTAEMIERGNSFKTITVFIYRPHSKFIDVHVVGSGWPSLPAVGS